MAASLIVNRCFMLIALLSIALTSCKSDTTDIIDRALECFHDRYVYSACQEDYRLNAEGTIHVPPEAVDAYCSGPCLAETKLVLRCINGIMENFRFFNGALTRDIGRNLVTGCSHSEKRGDFDVFGENIEGDDDYFDGGHKLAASTPLVIIFSCLLLLWG